MYGFKIAPSPLAFSLVFSSSCSLSFPASSSSLFSGCSTSLSFEPESASSLAFSFEPHAPNSNNAKTAITAIHFFKLIYFYPLKKTIQQSYHLPSYENSCSLQFRSKLLRFREKRYRRKKDEGLRFLIS